MDLYLKPNMQNKCLKGVYVRADSPPTVALWASPLIEQASRSWDANVVKDILSLYLTPL